MGKKGRFAAKVFLVLPAVLLFALSACKKGEGAMAGATGPASAAPAGVTITVLHSFAGGMADGKNPYSGLIIDDSGAIYGTTDNGGTHGGGTVFKLTPNGNGGYTESVLYNFSGWMADGAQPAGLILDASGAFYGTTQAGGANDEGVVFKLAPGGAETVLHSFGAVADGSVPWAGLIMDGKGALFGTTDNGGTGGYGAVFELTPNGSGGYTESVLHSFWITETDGAQPDADLIIDASGALYGTTKNGGAHGGGTVFKLTPNSSGGYTERVIYSFGATAGDGAQPDAGLIIDASGALYGTTEGGNASGGGTVFKLTPNGSSGYTESVLYSFDAGTSDGGGPKAGLIMDARGILYGTTEYGGAHGGGTVFKLAPNGTGDYTEHVLYSFGATAADGKNPVTRLVMDSAGALYGTTNGGGIYNGGTVFKLTP